MGLRVLILSAGPDNGGVGAGIKRAFEHCAPDWEVRVAVRRKIWFGWDTDLLWRVPTDIAPLFKRADVVHMMDNPAVVEGFVRWKAKPRILHHHGEVWRLNVKEFAARCKAEKVNAYAATFEIAASGLPWLPHPVDLAQMNAIPKRPRRRFTIAQSPSARNVNDTAVLETAFRTGISADLQVIERLPWRAHLTLKANANAVFDSLNSGYGMTLAEAWGLGLPGIAGSDDRQIMDRMTRELGEVPYYPVTKAGLADELRAFVTDPKLCAEYTERGQRALRAFHSEEAVVERLKRVYQEAIG